ncbi:TonB-dependent siderophore receptor [Steroidobacter sp. S1-65]|uniref:TonB-dependent siderophore receptor n=1 Tax=Steroidobacter gossypii TaxID=2805490 RepID=A0ABS1WT95_9GAMM|nr:TonB-dependent siderophore receptor [Steroidobacter gossypii]MBM0104202.1 TonB-dependent siderophore receptor [Steroidobacter gossypii]
MNKLSVAVACTLALASAARAQESGGEGGTLEEVTVLADRAGAATKTDTLLVEIPQSISVVTAEQIMERGATSYQEVFRYSAGVATELSGGDTRSDYFAARGFALKQFLDGLNKTPKGLYGSTQETFTLERAEVLRGPSAVLYGAGSSGGLLNAVSKRPQWEFGGEIGLQAGNWDRKQLQVDLTGPLGEDFAGRFVGVLRDGDLMWEGQANDKYVVMPSLAWKPGEQTDITLIGLYQKEDMGTQTYLPMSKTLQANADNPKIPIDFFVGEPDFNHMDTEQASVTLLVNHRFNELVAVSSNTRYLNQTVDYGEVYPTFNFGVDTFIDPERTTLSRAFYLLDDSYTIVNSDNHAQFDFDTGPVSHKVLVGVDYTLFEQDRREGYSCVVFYPGCFEAMTIPLNVYNPVYGQPFNYGYSNAFDSRSTQLGFYLQDQMKLADRVSFVFGARRDRATSEATLSPKETVNATTFKFGVIAEVLPGVSPFASYSESFTPIFGGDFYGNAYKPQQGEQYEAGIKWQPFSNSLITATYFDIEDSNFLTSDPSNLQNFIQSGVIGSKGVELEAQVNLAMGLSVNAAWSYTKAEVLEGTSSHPAGDRIEDLPNHLASLWLSQMLYINNDLTMRLGAGVRRVGDKLDYYQIQKTPAVTLVDASVEATYKDWSLQINANNVADKEYYATCAAWATPFDGMCTPGQTRSILGTVTRKF